jgi:hypothetical protein
MINLKEKLKENKHQACGLSLSLNSFKDEMSFTHFFKKQNTTGDFRFLPS